MHFSQINVRSGNQEWTIHRHWQHWVYKTQDEDKQSKKHNTENEKDEQHGPYQKPSEHRYTRRVSNTCVLQDTHYVTHQDSVKHNYTQANTNTINKTLETLETLETLALLQTTGDEDEQK